MSSVYDSSLTGEEFDEEFDEGAEDTSPEARMAMARTMGWRPREEYRGDPARWTDYEEFLRKGEEELPVMREQNKRMSGRIQRLEGQIGTLTKTIEEQAQAVRAAEQLARRADDAGYQRALRELKSQQREAVSQGDTDTYDQVSEQLEALETARRDVAVSPPPPPPPPPASPPVPPAASPEVGDFVKDNAAWFFDAARPYLKQTMIALHNAVIAEGVESGRPMPIGDQLEEALTRLKAQFPDDFGDDEMPPRTRQPRPQPTAMRPRGGGYPPRTPPGGGDPFMRIDATERPEARKAFESMKRHDPTVTPDEYVQIYENPRLDILSLRRQRK